MEALESRVRTLETKILRTGSTAVYLPKEIKPIVMGPANTTPNNAVKKSRTRSRNGNYGKNGNRRRGGNNRRRVLEEARSDIDILVEGGDDAYKVKKTFNVKSLKSITFNS